MSGPTSLSSYSAQINTTHPHTCGGWASFQLSNHNAKNLLSVSTGYMLPRPPPSCFDQKHVRKSPRTKYELMSSSSNRLSKSSDKDSTTILSNTRRSPCTNFVGTSSNIAQENMKKTMKLTSAKSILSIDEIDFDRKLKSNYKIGKYGKTFNKEKKNTGKLWESKTKDLPGPGEYGICEIIKKRNPITKFNTSLSLERPENENCPGPGAYRVLQQSYDRISKRTCVGCGYFGSSPRFTSRADRCRLTNPNELLPSTSAKPIKNYENLNKMEAVNRTSFQLIQKYKRDGKKLDERIKKVKKKRILLLMNEDKRCSLILARPLILKKKRRIKTLLTHLCNGSRIIQLMDKLSNYWLLKEIENQKIASIYFFQRFFKYWKIFISKKKTKRFQNILYYSSKFIIQLKNIRYKREQIDIIRRHLLSQVSASKAIQKIQSYKSCAITIQKWVRSRIMRDACHLIILMKQLRNEWNKRFDNCNDANKKDGDGGTTIGGGIMIGGGGNGENDIIDTTKDIFGRELLNRSSSNVSSNSSNYNNKKKKKKKRKIKKAMKKNNKNYINEFIKPTPDELNLVILGVAKNQLSIWRKNENMKGNGKKRFGLFTNNEIEHLMFETKELWILKMKMK
jgi:hypothetical protein